MRVSSSTEPEDPLLTSVRRETLPGSPSAKRLVPMSSVEEGPARRGGRWVQVLACLGALTSHGCSPPNDQVITSRIHHLGDSELPEWDAYGARPEAARLDLSFSSPANDREWTLSLVQQDVDVDWMVWINEREIAQLPSGTERRTFHLPLPAGVLRAGQNRLSLVPKREGDDILIGDIRLLTRPFREVLGLKKVRVIIRDRENRPLPGRLAVRLDDGSPYGKAAEIFYAERPLTAIRPGIAYTATGTLEMELLPGRYRVHATRGVEWGKDEADFALDSSSDLTEVTLTLSPEVDTTGYVACDTHIHTFTHSGHGDASVKERLVTLAGEGVELAIATDHNHNTDYRPAQTSLQLDKSFTAVTGNEVTTDNGHFNAFPLNPKDEIPNYMTLDWSVVVQGAKDLGAQVVILNHPRWPGDRSPFDHFELKPLSGQRRDQRPFSFDAIELINSDSLEKDPLRTFRDWFGLLNRGIRPTAIGSSDSHAVGVIVGQGRTYVPVSEEHPSKIPVDEACAAFLEGRPSVSMGIFADVWVNQGARPGDVVALGDGSVTVRLRVAAPSWVSPRRAMVFLNGILTHERALSPLLDRPFDRLFDVELPAPRGDATLVCIVLGDGIEGPWWPTAEDYTIAATNPIYLDRDGNGRFDSPFDQAQPLIADLGDEATLRTALTARDAAVAIQLLAHSLDQAPEREHESRRQELLAIVRPLDLPPEITRYLERLAPPPEESP